MIIHFVNIISRVLGAPAVALLPPSLQPAAILNKVFFNNKLLTFDYFTVINYYFQATPFYLLLLHSQ